MILTAIGKAIPGGASACRGTLGKKKKKEKKQTGCEAGNESSARHRDEAGAACSHRKQTSAVAVLAGSPVPVRRPTEALTAPAVARQPPPPPRHHRRRRRSLPPLLPAAGGGGRSGRGGPSAVVGGLTGRVPPGRPSPDRPRPGRCRRRRRPTWPPAPPPPPLAASRPARRLPPRHAGVRRPRAATAAVRASGRHGRPPSNSIASRRLCTQKKKKRGLPR